MRDSASRRAALAAVSLAVLFAACGGGTAVTTTTAAPSTTTMPSETTVPPMTTILETTTTSTTTTSTTTTTVPPTTTTTTTTLPPPVVGWDGAGASVVAIEFEFEPATAAFPVRSILRGHLGAMGIGTDDDATAVLRLDLDGTARSRRYGSTGRCYSGAKVSGEVALAAPDRPDLTERISYDFPAPRVIFTSECASDPDGAPYVVAFRGAIIPALTGIWGEAAAPALIEIIGADIRDSGEDLPIKAKAMDEIRGLDPDLLDPSDIGAALAATIDTVEYIVHHGITPHGADVAARKLLTAYSGTNYGVATYDDVDEWRDWLDGWLEQQEP